MIVHRRPWRDVCVIGVEQIGRRHVGARDMGDRRDRVERMQCSYERRHLRVVSKIALGHDQPVGQRYLINRFRVLPKLAHAVQGIDRGHDRIQTEISYDQRLVEQHLHDRSGVGEAGCFNQQTLKRRRITAAAPTKQRSDGAFEIAADIATQAPIR